MQGKCRRRKRDRSTEMERVKPRRDVESYADEINTQDVRTVAHVPFVD